MAKYAYLLSAVILISLGVLLLQSRQGACEVVRAVFDVGSGTTKMRLYRYDECRRKIVSRMDKCNANTPVDYGEDLIDSNIISTKTTQKGIKALQQLKASAEICGAWQFSGVATSAFRQASNGLQTVEKLSRTTGIRLALISQDEEARLGFEGALAVSNLDRGRTCVWDIGASSMQITCPTENGEENVYKGHIASVPFKQTLIKLNPDKRSSPNPISPSEYRQALAIAKERSHDVLEALGKFPRDLGILGIGGVHYHAVSKTLGLKEYSADQIRASLQDKLSKTDTELGGGNFVDTSVSNLILVEGMMRALDIPSVRALNIDLAEGLVGSRHYW